MYQSPVIGAEWLDDLDPIQEPLEKEIAAKLGNSWWTTTLGPIAVMTEEQGVFDTRFLDDAKDKTQEPLFRLVKSLFLLGYEIGKKENASKRHRKVVNKSFIHRQKEESCILYLYKFHL